MMFAALIRVYIHIGQTEKYAWLWWESNLVYEYRDLFIDMDVRNNRSELAIANRHLER